MIALALFKQIAALFLMMAAGFLLVKIGLLKQEDSKPVSTIIVYLILPATVIHAFQIDYTPEIRDGFLLALGAAVLVQGGLLVLGLLLAKPCKLSPIELNSIVYSNAGNLCIPLIIVLFGEEWVIYLTPYLCFQMILLWSHGNHILEGGKFSWKKILLNVNMIAIFMGLVLFLLRIQLPTILNSAVSWLAACVGPMGMIMLGMLLAQVKWKEVFSHPRIYLITALRLVILPLIMLVILRVSGLGSLVEGGQTILLITLLAASTPSATTVAQLAQIHDNQPAYASAINMATTILSLVTMPLIVYLFML